MVKNGRVRHKGSDSRGQETRRRQHSNHTGMGVGGAPEVHSKLGAMKTAAGATGSLCLGPGSLR